MAPQGGLGWPKDPATAPHEELREAALSCCPKLISLDSNKMAPIFICFWVFFKGGGTYWMGGGAGTEANNRWREEKEKKSMGQKRAVPLSFPVAPHSPPLLRAFMCNGGGGNK